MIEFGPFAVKKATDRGEKAESFDFLGFTHYCSRARDGSRFRMKRKTISKPAVFIQKSTSILSDLGAKKSNSFLPTTATR